VTSRAGYPNESLLSSPTFRVLRVLAGAGGFVTISRICREANVNHPVASRILSRLREKNVVSEKRVGRTRMFRANYHDERVSLLRKLATSSL